MNQEEEKQPYKPKGVLPIRAEWRYRPDGSYFKGTKNTAHFTDYYHSNIKGQRVVCEICKANISAGYRYRHQKTQGLLNGPPKARPRARAREERT